MKPLLIVDGYNVIGAWKEAEKQEWALGDSRDRLLRLLEDYSGYSGEEIVLVFDGYMSERRVRTEEQRGNVTLVYTRHGETADAYIERLVAQTPKYRAVRVATSDGLEQSQVLSTGAVRMTSRELLRELWQIRRAGMSVQENAILTQRSLLEQRLDSRTRSILEAMRRGNGNDEPEEKKRPANPQPLTAAKRAAPAQGKAAGGKATAQAGEKRPGPSGGPGHGRKKNHH